MTSEAAFDKAIFGPQPDAIPILFSSGYILWIPKGCFEIDMGIEENPDGKIGKDDNKEASAPTVEAA